MNRLASTLIALCQTVIIQMKLSMARETFKFIILIYPFTFSTLAILMYGNTSPERVFYYVILGSGFTTLWSSIVFSSASDISRERYYGTLEIIFTAPISFFITLMGKIIGNTIWGIFSMILSVLYLVLFYQIRIEIYHPLLFSVAVFSVLLSFAIVAFFLAMLFTLSRQAEVLMNFMQYPIYLLCGFLFPITTLPTWTQFISDLLPPTWAIQLLRSASQQSIESGSILTPLIALTVLTLLLGTAGAFGYKILVRKARTHGKLGVY